MIDLHQKSSELEIEKMSERQLNLPKTGKELAKIPVGTRVLYKHNPDSSKIKCPKWCKGTISNRSNQKAKHGADAPEMDENFVCPYCHKGYRIKKSWAEHKPYCSQNPNFKGPYYCRVTGCPAADHPFTRMRNLNFHMSNMHGWKERRA